MFSHLRNFVCKDYRKAHTELKDAVVFERPLSCKDWGVLTLVLIRQCPDIKKNSIVFSLEAISLVGRSS